MTFQISDMPGLGHIRQTRPFVSSRKCHVFLHMGIMSETLVLTMKTAITLRLKWSKVRAIVRFFFLSDIPAHSPLVGYTRAMSRQEEEKAETQLALQGPKRPRQHDRPAHQEITFRFREHWCHLVQL